MQCVSLLMLQWLGLPLCEAHCVDLLQAQQNGHQGRAGCATVKKHVGPWGN